MQRRRPAGAWWSNLANLAHAARRDLPEEHSATQHVSLGTYLVVFAALIVLLAITVAVAFFVHAGDLNLIIALAIATIKATLVVLYFMHVKYASRLTKIFVCAAFLWLLILFGLTFSDYLTRDWLPVSKVLLWGFWRERWP